MIYCLKMVIIICGKFQVASINDHPGYQYMFSEAIKKSNNIMIVLGISNKRNIKNILTYEQRYEVIKKYFNENYPTANLKITSIYDVDDDVEWYCTLNKLVANNYIKEKSIFYMGSRDSFLKQKELLIFPVIELPGLGNYSSSQIRELISKDELSNPCVAAGYQDFKNGINNITSNRNYLRGYMLGYIECSK